MRLTVIGAAVALGVLACKGKEQAPASQPAAQPEAAAAQPAGQVVQVNMTGTGNVFKFEPDVIHAPAGATVRFINVSGGPHNVTFYSDSIPAGTADKLNAAMANRMDNLSGPFLINANDHYDISLAGLPAGTYKGYCTPHQALGMKFTLMVM
ncbi:MAG TPA: plastocyanin/azurin family copper-binding protein [Gemmatimonadales bacterium]|jgi:plastocyanin|nr:plastocyanin/azurin family copper-binding protein [Gemmatimonadales bacterium]